MARRSSRHHRQKSGNPAKAGGTPSAPPRGATRSATPAPSAKRRRPLKRWEVAALAVVGLLVLWGGWTWWSSRTTTAEFDSLVAAGQGALDQVQTLPNAGRDHLARGQSFRYPAEFPTSGPHDPVSINAGFYDEEMPPTQPVHSLEHGLIVIYFDQLATADLEMLREWSALFRGPFSVVVVTRKSGLGEGLVLTAWQRVLRLDNFNAATGAASTDRFRGRGPENPVR